MTGTPRICHILTLVFLTASLLTRGSQDILRELGNCREGAARNGGVSVKTKERNDNFYEKEKLQVCTHCKKNISHE